MMRSALRVAVVLVAVLCAISLWKLAKEKSTQSSIPIQPLMIDKNSLVGSWIGHGGKNNEIEVKVEITNDFRVPPEGTGNALEEQMYDNFRTGLLPTAQGTVSITGLGGECKSVSGAINRGMVDGNKVWWSGYAGRVGADDEQWGQNRGGWEDTVQFDISGTLNPADITGSAIVKANSDDCTVGVSFPIVMYLVKSPSGAKAAPVKLSSNSVAQANTPKQELASVNETIQQPATLTKKFSLRDATTEYVADKTSSSQVPIVESFLLMPSDGTRNDTTRNDTCRLMADSTYYDGTVDLTNDAFTCITEVKGGVGYSIIGKLVSTGYGGTEPMIRVRISRTLNGVVASERTLQMRGSTGE